MTITIQQASKKDLEVVNELVLEYLHWDVGHAKDVLGEIVDVNDMLNHSNSEMDLFFAPTGRLLLAKEGDRAVGTAFLKKLREDTCEVKRMYVRPEFRGKKVGKNLLGQLIQDAKLIGYSKILLDSAIYMEKAHSLYRSMGFIEVDRYPESEMDLDFQKYMVYMELKF